MPFLLLAVALLFAPSDAERAYKTADAFVKKCTPRDAGTIRGKVAANFILDKASAMGADVRRDMFVTETPKGARWLTNLTCEFRTNASSDWVVLVSHFDTKTGVDCPGANDGASSSALLIALSSVLSSCKELPGNVMLVWTDGEECMCQYGEDDGLWGSKRVAARLKESGRKVKAVICVDMIGDKDLHVSVPSNGDEALTELAIRSAAKVGCPRLVTKIPAMVTDDHVAFIDNGFPAIDLIDFEYGPGNSYWHTPQDTMEHVSEESLLKVGQLLAEMLNALFVG